MMFLFNALFVKAGIVSLGTWAEIGLSSYLFLHLKVLASVWQILLLFHELGF